MLLYLISSWSRPLITCNQTLYNDKHPLEQPKLREWDLVLPWDCFLLTRGTGYLSGDPREIWKTVKQARGNICCPVSKCWENTGLNEVVLEQSVILDQLGSATFFEAVLEASFNGTATEAAWGLMSKSHIYLLLSHKGTEGRNMTPPIKQQKPSKPFI